MSSITASILARHAITALLLLGGVSNCVSTDTPPLRSNVELGHEYARDGLLREAAQAYRKALKQDSNLIVAHRNLGLVYVKTGDYKRAIVHLQRALPDFRDNFETNFFLAQALRAEDRFGDAIFYYKNALALKPNDPKCLKALAWSNYKIRYYSEALNRIMELKKIANEDMQTHIILARIYLKLKQETKALAVIRNAQTFAKKSEYPYLLSVEGDVLLAMGKNDAAQKAYRNALKEQPLLAGSLLGLGRTLIAMGTGLDQASSYIERAIRLKPKLKEGLFYLGRAYEKTDFKKSARYYRAFKKQALSDPDFTEELATVTAKLDDWSKMETKTE